MCEKNKLKLDSTAPLFFDAFYISLLSSKKAGTSFLSGLYNGFLSNLLAKKSGEYSSLIYFIKKRGKDQL